MGRKIRKGDGVFELTSFEQPRRIRAERSMQQCLCDNDCPTYCMNNGCGSLCTTACQLACACKQINTAKPDSNKNGYIVVNSNASKNSVWSKNDQNAFADPLPL